MRRRETESGAPTVPSSEVADAVRRALAALDIGRLDIARDVLGDLVRRASDG